MPLWVPSVLASMEISSSAAPQPCGMEEQPDAFILPMVQWSTRPEILSASMGTNQLDASDPIPAATSAQAAEAQPIEPSTVLMHYYILKPGLLTCQHLIFSIVTLQSIIACPLVSTSALLDPIS